MGLAAVVLAAAFSFPANGRAPGDSTTDRSNTVRVSQAASDSTKPILLPPVVVSAPGPRPGDSTWVPRSARFLYADDGSKMLLGDLRISSALPASADLRLYGLPVDQTARDYVWGHRIGGPVTAVFGTRTKVNPDVVSVALHPFLMSHQYRDTNGSLEWRPGFQSDHLQALSVSSDLIERRATVWLARDSLGVLPPFQLVTSVRQSDVAPILKAAVPALQVIPRYVDSQTFARVQLGAQTFEGFFLFGRERGDWRERVDSVDAVVLENTRQDLAVLRVERPLSGDSKLTAGVSWEGDHVYSEHRYGEFNEQVWNASHIVNPRIEYSMGDGVMTTWLDAFCIRSDPGIPAWRTSVDGGVESRMNLGWLSFQPSVAFQREHGEGTPVYGATLSAHPDQVTMTAGYSTYVDYFRFRDGMFGSVFDPGEAQRPQAADHVVASVQYEPKTKWPFELLRVTGVRKQMDVDLWEARNRVRVESWDCIMARSGRPSWEVAFLANDAQGREGPVVGLIPISLRVGISGDVVRSFNVSIEANYRSGSVAEYRTPGPRYGQRFMLDPSHYVNVALTQRFKVRNRPANVSVTVFNALAVAGSRAELTVDQYGRRYDAPCWANLRLHYDLW